MNEDSMIKIKIKIRIAYAKFLNYLNRKVINPFWQKIQNGPRKVSIQRLKKYITSQDFQIAYEDTQFWAEISNKLEKISNYLNTKVDYNLSLCDELISILEFTNENSND